MLTNSCARSAARADDVSGVRGIALERFDMRFYEFESKALFERHGLPLGPRKVVHSADEARRAAQEIGLPVVLKSQVLSGGRMKAGAVQVRRHARRMSARLFDADHARSK